jgi:nucleoside-diphosphate kinase
MVNPAIKERSLVILKPDAIQRSLMGEIIKRIERVGLKFVAMKFTILDEETLWKHYNKDDAWFEKKGGNIVREMEERGMTIEKPAIEYGKDILRHLINFMTSGPVLAMIVEGNGATGIVAKIVGGTEPLTADIGTIRADYTIDSYALAGLDGRAVRNLVHCSENPAEAEREIALWFAEKEVIKYRLVQDAILYDVNLDGILE